MRAYTNQAWDSQGNLVDSQVVAWTAEDYLREIAMLEDSITPRRRDEAMLNYDGAVAWLTAKRAEIDTLRSEMT